MKLVVSAGDPSGDVRASEVLSQLSSMAEITFVGLGGDRLAATGMTLHHHLREFSVMGFTEVLKSLKKLFALRRSMRNLLETVRPDALLLVDYPGLNIPLGVWARRRGIRVIYYVSPQLWAWGTGRVRKIARGVDLMITLFGFEVDFYREHGVRAEWGGHPLVGAVPVPLESPPDGHLALLPGSRAQEVSLLLPPMLECLTELRSELPGLPAKIAAVGSVSGDLYSTAAGIDGVEIVRSTAEALTGSRGALVCSGTATLETSLYGVPFVIAYRTSPVTFAMARMLVRGVDRIGMANLVAGEDIAPELIQGEVTGPALADAVMPFMGDGPERVHAIERLGRVRDALGGPGASRRAAGIIADFLSEGREGP